MPKGALYLLKKGEEIIMGKGFLRCIYLLSKLMEIVAGTALVFMMCLTTCDVILRAFGRPIIGTYEIISFSGGLVIGFSLPITSWVRGQIFVDFFYQKFSQIWQNVFNICTRLLSLVLFFFVGWNLMILATRLLKSGEVSLTLQMPFYPIAYGIGVACFVQCLVLIGDLLKIKGGEYE
jgi:TRAP-type C4-dicarboxylate transport system permease small subunit